MNGTIVRITARGMLGGRRLVLLLGMALLLVALAVVVRLFAEPSPAETVQFLQAVSLASVMPLFGLIVGTGAIGPDIDDGSIVYLLSKPVPRATIVRSKLAVGVGAMLLFAVVPTAVAALIMAGVSSGITAAFGLGALVAGAVYCVLFLLLAVLTRHAVVVGLVYALAWESLVGSFVPGARNLSVQQWALSFTDAVLEPGLMSAHVGIGLAIVLAAGTFAAGTWFAGERLRRLVLTSEE